jgi:hypothetical protein
MDTLNKTDEAVSAQVQSSQIESSQHTNNEEQFSMFDSESAD